MSEIPVEVSITTVLNFLFMLKLCVFQKGMFIAHFSITAKMIMANGIDISTSMIGPKRQAIKNWWSFMPIPNKTAGGPDEPYTTQSGIYKMDNQNTPV